MDLLVPCAVEGRYVVVARMAAGPDLGTVQPAVSGAPAGGPVDLYAPLMTPREITLGTFEAKGGVLPVSFTLTGANPASKGHRVGIDAFILKPAQ